MKPLLLSLAIALVFSACDRRVGQVDNEESMAADSSVAPADATDPNATVSPPAGATDQRCADLTGQARIDCESMPDPMDSTDSRSVDDPMDEADPMNPVDPADPPDQTDPMDPANPTPTDTTDGNTPAP